MQAIYREAEQKLHSDIQTCAIAYRMQHLYESADVDFKSHSDSEFQQVMKAVYSSKKKPWHVMCKTDLLP
jgi:hypothetical protein